MRVQRLPNLNALEAQLRTPQSSFLKCDIHSRSWIGSPIVLLIEQKVLKFSTTQLSVPPELVSAAATAPQTDQYVADQHATQMREVSHVVIRIRAQSTVH